MSFSSSVKSELCNTPLGERCCVMAELAAFVHMNGTMLFLGNNEVGVYFSTENAAVARRIFKLVKGRYKVQPEILVRKNQRLKKNNVYMVAVLDSLGARTLLEDVHVLYKDELGNTNIYEGIKSAFVENECCRRAYLRATFLGGGYISDPEKNYHLEIVTHGLEYAQALSDLIERFNLRAKIVERKGNYVVYFKEGENIANFLNVIGAHQALLELENIRACKDMRNNINRIVNCETANLGKTVNAAVRQIENIEYIRQTIGLHMLSPQLREIAELRLKYRDATLRELGSMLTPPIGKSGVNHRLRKLDEIADALRKEKKEEM
ncbi:DNA-binding protein WhiA [Caldicoprobacter guelmensis]|uniref:DNA-binding protein WhiA n=1 Tax=Caldicoprobacter guelmensis TaxID=1170224 RepID=UPI001957B5A0|nr:DNA-binding protein WhiA [Caldicoprobacter guelmensis]MBM7581552.1 DNA-binding protein WhiA [Caldicoprobacter guelmensis]